MWRMLLRSCHLSMTIQTAKTKFNFNTHQRDLQLLKQLQMTTLMHYKNLTMNHTKESEEITDPPKAGEAVTSQHEGEYNVGYDVSYERSATKSEVSDVLTRKLRMTHREVDTIINDDTFLRSYKEQSVLYNLEILIAAGVNKRSFIDYPWLLALRTSVIRSSLQMLEALPIRDINHFVGLMRLNKPRLKKLVDSLIRESTYIPEGNRIYYISKMLNTDPYIVSKYLSRRLFVLEIPFELLEMNLHNMIDYKVEPLSVLRDLWAFRYAPKSVQQRFQRATMAKKDKIMPWMVRCPEPILQHSLKLTLDEMAVLGDKKDTVEYVADRLNFGIAATRAIMLKHPKTLSVRVTKVKEVLDYLLNEAGFTTYEIAQAPRILCHSLETTKQRFNELKSYGCRPTTLVILCLSKREFEKFVKKWLSNQRERKTDSSTDAASTLSTSPADGNKDGANNDTAKLS